MFIVYSPEAQSATGASPLVPQLRIDPSKKVVAVGESSLDELHTDVEHSEQKGGGKELLAYQKVMKSDAERRPMVRAKELMSQPVITIMGDRGVDDAWNLMAQSKVHHLPVVLATGMLEGLITLHDILLRSVVTPEGELQGAQNLKVADLMQTEVITTNPETDIRRLAEVMATYHLGCMPIMSEQHKLIGMITLSDIVRRLAMDPPLELYA